MNLSLCMIVKNEELHLERCLKSVQGIVDEIIVVDTGSTDKTINIAQEYGATIIKYEWNHDFAAARNAGLDIAKGDYILVLDADEELEEAAKSKLGHFLNMNAQGYMLLIENYHEEEMTSGSVLRIFKNRTEYRFQYPIHEQIQILQEGRNPLVLTDITIKHYGYTTEENKRKDKRNRNREILETMVEMKHPYFMYQLAVEYAAIERHEKAHQLYEEVYSIVDRGRIYYPEVVAGYMSNCFYTNRLEKIHQLFEDNIEQFNDYTDLYSMDGKTYLRQGRFVEALKQFRAAFGRKPNPLYKCSQGVESYKTIIDIGQAYEMMGEKQFAIQCYQNAFRMKPSSDIFLLLLDFLGNRPEQIQLMTDDLSKYIHFDDEKNLHVVLFRLLLNGHKHSYELLRRTYNATKVNNHLFDSLINRDINQALIQLAKLDDKKSLFAFNSINKYKNDERLSLSELSLFIALNWDKDEILFERLENKNDLLEAIHVVYRLYGLERALPLYIQAFKNNTEDALSLQRIGDAFLQSNNRNDAAQMYFRSYKHNPTSTNMFRLIEFALQNGDLPTSNALLDEGLTLFKESPLLEQVKKIIKTNK